MDHIMQMERAVIAEWAVWEQSITSQFHFVAGTSYQNALLVYSQGYSPIYRRTGYAASINCITSNPLEWHTPHIDPFHFGPRGPLTSFIINTRSHLSWETVKHHHIGCHSRHDSQSTEESRVVRRRCDTFRDWGRLDVGFMWLYKHVFDFATVYFFSLYGYLKNAPVIILRIAVTVMSLSPATIGSNTILRT